MNEDVEKRLEGLPQDCMALFLALRGEILAAEPGAQERLWAKTPSYYAGERFIRLIPFKDHINVEASAAPAYREQLPGFRFTPKGLLRVDCGQEIPALFRRIVEETLRG